MTATPADVKSSLEEIDTASIETGIAALSTNAVDGMQLWSESKKIDFCRVFETRSRVSAYILYKTAVTLLETAERRQFIGTKHTERASKGCDGLRMSCFVGEPWYQKDRYVSREAATIGGRPLQELDGIAKERAEEVFQNLPPLKQAVQLIKPEVSVKMDKVEKLKDAATKFADELEKPELLASIHLSQVEQTMTIGDFRAMVKERTKKRHALVEKLNEVAKEAMELEDEIAKALFAGIPEIADAIVDVAKKHLERAREMGRVTRRVEESVKFGDSAAAVSIVKQFESDETAVSSSIKSEFDAALARLKMTGAHVRKTLAGKKKGK